MAVIEILVDSDTLVEVQTTGVNLSPQAPTEQVVVEVLAGRPGVQNLYVGPTPPPNPQEGWVWIDTS